MSLDESNVDPPADPSLEGAFEEDKVWMSEAIRLAEYASSLGEVPIGAVVVYDNQVIGRGWNLRESTQDPTAHAELEAIREAARYLGSWRLINCSLYVTLEPCPMCAGAIVNSRMTKCVYGATDPKAGAVCTLYELLNDTRLNHRLEVVHSVESTRCAQLLTGFFKAIREGRGVPKPKTLSKE